MENKNQKRALSFSMLSIVLCVAMLIGTTFAWFTDNASTGVNLIQAGTLDIELQKSEDNGETWTAVGKNESLAFQKAAEGEEVLWEPGVTYNLPLLRVVNKGNLALKYKIQISGLDGNAELLNAIDFTLKNGEEMVDLTTYEGHIAGMQESGSPTVDKELSSLTISGHMRESAGNEYQGLTLNGIYITVAATQDIGDLDRSRFGKGILNVAKTKIILNLEDDEARRVQSILHLSDAEIMSITRFERGQGLISTNSNHITVSFKASPLEKQLITTDRMELNQILQEKMAQNAHNADL
mgnify:CR=1 FL=1